MSSTSPGATRWLFARVWDELQGAWMRRPVRAPASPVPVLAVGSPSFGGAGKTPVVAWLARRLLAQGRRVAILGHGYGGASRSPRRGGDDPRADGDEAVELARALGPQVPVLLGRPRWQAARLAHEVADVLLLDGSLAPRDLTVSARILVEDATAAREVVPAGPLRFHPDRAPRVDLRWSHKVDHPGARVVNADVTSRFRATRLTDPDGELRPLETLASGAWVAISAIGRPEAFERTLRESGAELVEHRRFRDHARIPAAALRLPPGAQGVTTAKDAARLPPGHGLHILAGEVEVLTGLERVDALLAALRP